MGRLVFLIMEKKEKSTFSLDPWQKEFVDYVGDIALLSPRQHGKSEAAAAKAAEFAVKTPNRNVMIVSVTEDQAIELLTKCFIYIDANYKKRVKMGKDRPTKSVLKLTNGSIIRTKAVGQSGYSVLGFTNHMLIVDEAAMVPEAIWESLTPTLLTTGGSMVLLSTPHGRKGFFFQAFTDPDLGFKTIRVKLGDLEKRPISKTWTQFRKDKMALRIESERKRMSEREFKQQYLAEFVDDLGQFFPDDTIRKAMIQQRLEISREGRDFFLGVDVARMGDDACTFEIVERRGELLVHRENIVWRKQLLSEVTEKIKLLDSQWNFKRLYIDDGGIGVGVFDNLYSTPGFKKRTIAINNSTRVYNYNIDGKPKHKKLLKEDLYNNLLHLMEKGKIMILDDAEIWQSFKSIQYEYMNEKGGAVIRIFGDDSHIVEGLIRAAWCNKEKINKLRISYI